MQQRQALARQWRPQCFEDVIGQDPVVSILSNSLNLNRLHHAYLFTGTRGVGKTSLARIFAKSLNCQEGVSATPCGQCEACLGAAEGNFPDLIEIDAASRTRVEDTRELLEQMAYAPISGRYKVYLIDEVHMLSTHSFNALLKTLEEPPSHIKFLLATTDIEKLPPTVVSRCIQLRLLPLSTDALINQFKKILDKESLTYQPEALTMLAQLADGSVRDGLSALEQAIVLAGDGVTTEHLSQLYGLMPDSPLFELISDIHRGDGQEVWSKILSFRKQGINWRLILERLQSIVHKIALYQVVPESLVLSDNYDSNSVSNSITTLANEMGVEYAQMLLEILTLGLRDFSLIPSAEQAFERVMMRCLFFKPSNPKLEKNIAKSVASDKLLEKTKTEIKTQIKTEKRQIPSILPKSLPENLPENLPEKPIAKPIEKPIEKPIAKSAYSESMWPEVAKNLVLDGMTRSVVMRCRCKDWNSKQIVLSLQETDKPLWSNERAASILKALNQAVEFTGVIDVQWGGNESDQQPTPMMVVSEEKQIAEQKNREKFEKNTIVNGLIEQLGGNLE